MEQLMAEGDKQGTLRFVFCLGPAVCSMAGRDMSWQSRLWPRSGFAGITSIMKAIAQAHATESRLGAL